MEIVEQAGGRAPGSTRPGGRAAYPSSVLMGCVAGAGRRRSDRVALATRRSPTEASGPVTLAAAAIAGVDEVYALGGAQAVAALALGTETIDAGRRRRRARQRLGHGGQAPALRRGRDRRARGPQRARDRRSTPRADTDAARPRPAARRPSTAPTARCSRSRPTPRRSTPSPDADRRPPRPAPERRRRAARAGRGARRSRPRSSSSDALAPEHLELHFEGADARSPPSRRRGLRLRRRRRRRPRSATTRPAPTTCCRPAAPRASRGRSASGTFMRRTSVGHRSTSAAAQALAPARRRDRAGRGASRARRVGTGRAGRRTRLICR